MRIKAMVGSAVLAGALMVGSGAGAAVSFDPATGTGFVGKGDVQLVFGWNNKALQDNAGSVQFRVASTTVSEVSWLCTNTNNETTQERARTTTESLQGVFDSIARERNQFTGFNLNGFDGVGGVSTVTDGPPLNSCPSGPWTLTTPAGDPVLDEDASTSVFQVSVNGTTWLDLDL